MEPFAMLYLANRIKEYRASKPDRHFLAKSCNHLTYPSHMGFFQAFGLRLGNRAGEACGGNNYLPITVINIAELRKKNLKSLRSLGCDIQDMSSKLAATLTQSTEGDSYLAVRYSFRELIRNVFEHSGAGELDYCAQHWPAKGISEISILDTGIGVREGLKNNPYLSIGTDREALEHCVMPGISGAMFKGVELNPYDRWQNSGYGLYVASRLGQQAGQFFICSGQTGMLLQGDTIRRYDFPMNGTALRLRIDVNKLCDVSASIDRIVNEGEEAAQRIGVSFKSASKASRFV